MVTAARQDYTRMVAFVQLESLHCPKRLERQRRKNSTRQSQRCLDPIESDSIALTRSILNKPDRGPLKSLYEAGRSWREKKETEGAVAGPQNGSVRTVQCAKKKEPEENEKAVFAVEIALRSLEAHRAQELLTQLANCTVWNLVAAQMHPGSLKRHGLAAVLQKALEAE